MSDFDDFGEDWDVDIIDCPVCGTAIIDPIGNPDSPILLIGEFPGDEEIKKGIPFVGPTGNVLKTELHYLGIDISQLRVTNLWLHKPNGNEECYKHGLEQAIKEAKGKKLVLLIGSDVVKEFADKKVYDVNGLQVKSKWISAPCFCVLNPAIVFKRGGVGEVRLAIQKFVKKIEEIL